MQWLSLTCVACPWMLLWPSITYCLSYQHSTFDSGINFFFFFGCCCIIKFATAFLYILSPFLIWCCSPLLVTCSSTVLHIFVWYSILVRIFVVRLHFIHWMFFTLLHIMCFMHFFIYDFISYVAFHFISALHTNAFDMDAMPFISPHLIRSPYISLSMISLFVIWILISFNWTNFRSLRQSITLFKILYTYSHLFVNFLIWSLLLRVVRYEL